MSCGLGRLYNKDAVIEHVVSEESPFGDADKTAPHIKRIKDVVELKLTRAESNDKKDENAARWICPVTRREMNGKAGVFVYLVPCGHVFSEMAIRELKTDACLDCSTPFLPRDIIVINPKTNALATLTERLVSLINEGLTHSLAPIKKSKKRKVEALDSDAKRLATRPSIRQDTAIGDLVKKVGSQISKEPKSTHSPAVQSLYNKQTVV